MSASPNDVAVPGHLHFEDGPSGPAAVVANAHAEARVLLQGAHVVHYQPRGQRPVLYVSPRAVFAPGKAVRGGIPVCWPWFGPHPVDAAKPAHGYVRTAMWRMEGARALPDGGTELAFTFPDPLSPRLTVAVGESLRVALSMRNGGSAPVTVGGALHSYFAVGDVSRVRLSGFHDVPYVDQLDPSRRNVQAGDVAFTAETDRVYAAAPEAALEDPVWGRRIRIKAEGSRSTVVWNPWDAKAARLADLGADQYPRFVCVETANALADSIDLPSGGTHRLAAEVRAEPL